MIALLENKTTARLAAIMTILFLSGCGQQSDNAASRNSGDAGPASSAAGADRTRRGQSERAVVAETLAYAEINEQLVKGHFAFPEDMIESYPAIILIHEWWGLNDRVRALAERIAAEGFVVLAIDLYDGRVATSKEDARKLMLNVIEHPEFAALNIRLANDWVRETAGAEQVGVIGYGLGGGWSLNAIIALPDQFDAAVIFYGQVPKNANTLAAIHAPILGFFGAADSTIPADSVAGFERALKTLGKVHDIQVYPGAKGGFASHGDPNFDKDLTSRSWHTMLEFLHQHLNSVEANPN